MNHQVNIEKYNQEIINQSHATRRRIVGRISRMSVKGKTELLKSIQSAKARQSLLNRISSERVLARSFFVRFGKDYGEIDLISYKFPIHGIYAHHGVSRSRPASNKRKQLQWLNPVIDADLDHLADIVVKHYADATLNATRLKI
ncbi:MAG: hypothetical protein RQ761_10390 [Bacteroidales bacterium]|nr:hypothetical protein [Bacteroidales bacterium]